MNITVTALHQIELTSRCDLRCVYCTNPVLARPKLDISEEHFDRALTHAAFYVQMGTQSELNLAGIGESTLHPRFPEFVRRARERVGGKVKLVMATNGLNIAKGDGWSREIVSALTDAQVKVHVSLHRPEKAAHAVRLLEQAGVLAGFSADPVTNPDNWAGQVEWMQGHRTPIPCQWLTFGRAFCMADGRVSACCLDASGVGVIGHVDDPAASLKTRPYKLCDACQFKKPGA